ncbi:unannotated protein [freshwater metagenome]|uniref:Unannotated protein n=2 Tax=freshwater metagenome TaxID=449393 RepID=A0A6J6GRW8_9ZZZZ
MEDLAIFVYFMHNVQMKNRIFTCLALAGLGLLAACGGADTNEAYLKNAARVTTTTAIATTTTSPATTTTVASSSGSTKSVICGADNAEFPDLTQFAGAGSGYDAPKVVVTCGSDTLTVASNGITSYTYVQKTPAGLKSQNFSWTVSTKPKIASATTSIETKMSAVAFTVTGLPIYGPMEGPTPSQEAYGDPVYNDLLDSCGGHTGYNADYHYHKILAISSCSLEETIIGYALDGFPIYSNPQYKWKSGYEKTGNPTSYSWNAYTYTGGTSTLDKCNGQEQSDGSYRYYVTESFPYVIGCYAGTAKKQTGVAAQAMPPMGSVSKSSAFLCTINRDDLNRLGDVAS